MDIVLLGLAMVALVLIPLAPMLVRLRIRIVRWLHWTWAVNVLEKYFDRWVLVVRCVLFVVALVLLYLSWVRA